MGAGFTPIYFNPSFAWNRGDAERFWIGHRIDNKASQHGIEKAGFQLVSFVILTSERKLRLVPCGNRARSYGNPQGRHFGFLEAEDEQLVAFDFSNISEKDIDASL